MLKSFLGLWLKFPCPLCQRIAEDTLCKFCQKKLISYQIANPLQNWKGTLPLFAWGKYDGELSRAIAKLKYENHPEIGTILGAWLGKTWLKNCPLESHQKPIVLPIPLHQTRSKTRGFNQAELIAKSFCQETKYSLQAQEIIRVKDTTAMFGLSAVQRKNNLQNAFQVSQKWQQNPPSSPILLLDDIYTRGTTVREVTRTLRQYNINVLGAIAVAKTIQDNRKNS